MKLTIKTIDKLHPDPNRDIYIWDEDLPGFGLRIKSSGVFSFFIQYRNSTGISRRLTLGKLGVLTPEEARKLAKEKLAEVTKGSDPAGDRHVIRKSITVSELCDLYLEAAKVTPGPRGRIKKQSTLDLDIGRVKKHIKILLGRKPVASLTLRDIEKMQSDIAAGKTATARPEKGRTGVVTGGAATAARTTGLLSTILEYARRQEIIKDNPARGVKKYPDQKRKRYLNAKEIGSLGKAMREALKTGESKTGIAAIRALLLTGCRRNEILALPWTWLDQEASCIRFEDTKTGAQIRPIGSSAMAYLTARPKTKMKDNKAIKPWVFPADRGDGHYIGLPKVLDRLCNKAKLHDVTLHTLRHTYASVAAELGFTELTIAGLLGHTARGVTNRYSHLPDSALLSAANRVSEVITATLDQKKSPSAS